MRVFITGISGYLGSLLTSFLADDEKIREIKGIDIKEPSFKHEKVKFIKCDIRDENLLNLMKGCDVAVHLAFIV